MNEPDVIVVGAGLAGLVATHELVKAGRKVLVLDQENRNNLGGQAFWSLGGLFFVDSPEQRRMGIKDSKELALQDWLGSAGFDRPRRRGRVAAAVGRGVRRVRGHREARLPPRAGPARAADRGLGRARQRQRHRPRQLRAAVPPHLGHRPRGGPRVRRAGARRRGARAGRVRVPAPRRRPRGRGRRRGRRTRHRAGAERRRARGQLVARDGRRVRAPRPRRGRDQRRHRPQPRPDPARTGRSTGSARHPPT